VIENTSPATVISELATVVSSPRAPAAPAPKSSGQRAARCRSTLVSRVIRRIASAMPSTMRAGTNQKLDRIDSHAGWSSVIILGGPFVVLPAHAPAPFKLSLHSVAIQPHAPTSLSAGAGLECLGDCNPGSALRPMGMRASMTLSLVCKGTVKSARSIDP
jgi:hypothetical protein